MALVGGLWIETNGSGTARAYLANDVVAHGATAAQMAIRHWGLPDGPTLGDALVFAGHWELGGRLREADGQVRDLDTALHVCLDMQTDADDEALGDFVGFGVRANPEPAHLMAIRTKLAEAQAARAAVYAECRAIVDAAQAATAYHAAMQLP